MDTRSTKRTYWFSIAALFASIVSTIIIYLLLTRIDLIVHGELYYFGLQFSPEWADEYRTFMLLIYVFLLLPLALNGLALFFSFTAKESRKPPERRKETPQKVEQMTNHQPIAREESKTALTSKGDMITCPKCNRMFSTPSVILDYSYWKPRLVNACPYCNHVLEYQKRIR